MGRLRPALPLALSAAQALSAQSGPGAPARADYRGGVDLITLNVTVTDGQQRYVTNLDRRDFVVIEDGRPQKVAFFAHSGVPLTVALAIDTSGSMDTALGAAQDAAAAFVRRL